ncbi:hypothetical protein RND71_007338 [Anisodus tanguticus]|uniref:ArsA/GET3 Anion-transporting ATPase-like domain-containing protein n=1 Tax=Anisodus tanguticus TaxID=243964 RepID=A0AAE1SJN9_9SOLA|nr:hypothetical protein RND71_007338 [Anisodus tanguticus]
MASNNQDLPEGTVKNVLEQDTLKWVFVGGKGGVGKTTCSSILGILLSQVRSSVLIISTDPAHNLSDAFQQRFTKSPTLVNGFSNLYAMEIDPAVEKEDVVSSDGMDDFLSDLTNAIPGIDEAMSFAEMLKLVQTMDYSVIVFDTAPTGHTLRLLQFPSTLEKGLAKVMSLKSRFGGVLSQMTRLLGVDEEFGEAAILGKLEGMKDIIEEVNRQFKDPVCGVEALKGFSHHFITPYQSSLARGSVEELENRVAALKEQLKDSEAELEKVRKGKQKI